jgi:PAS domain-containing protein
MTPGKIELVLMRQLASYLAVPILIVNRRLDLLFFNEPAEPILGRRFEETGEVHRGEWSDLFQPADANGVPIPPEEQPLTRAIDRQEPSNSRFSLRGLDGTARVVEGVAFPLQTQEAGLIGAAGIFWEVRKEVATSSQLIPSESGHSRSRRDVEVILLRRLTDRLLMPVFVEDVEGRLLFYNPAAEPLVGRPFAQLGPVQLRDWYDAFQPTDENGSRIKLEDHPLSVARVRRQPCYRRFLYQGLDGLKHHIDATAFPLVGQCNRHLGAVGIFWEGRHEDHALGHTRLAGFSGPGDDAIRR